MLHFTRKRLINEVFKRIVNCAASNTTTVLTFAAANHTSAGAIVVGDAKYVRITNKDDTNAIEVAMVGAATLYQVTLAAGQSHVLGSPDDLMLADLVLNINLSNSNKSLNLSHAVLLVSYKWYEYYNLKKINSNINSKFTNMASKREFNFFMNYLKNELNRVGFLYPKEKSDKMFNNIKTVFLRSSLSKIEIKTLWGMFKKLSNRRKS